MEGNYLNDWWMVSTKMIANIIPNGEMLEALILNSGTRQGYHNDHLFDIEILAAQ